MKPRDGTVERGVWRGALCLAVAVVAACSGTIQRAGDGDGAIGPADAAVDGLPQDDGPLQSDGPLQDDGPLQSDGELQSDGPLQSDGQLQNDGPLQSDAPGQSDAPQSDGPPQSDAAVCGNLASRLRVTAVSVAPATVVVGSAAPWSNNRPIMIAPLASGASRVAWADSAGSVHVTSLDANDARQGADTSTTGTEVRGFVAHDDGGAVLVVRNDEMHLVRLDNAGAVVFDRLIVGGGDRSITGAKWVDNWGHEGRLAWTGTQYLAYFGHTQNWGTYPADDHQGDILQYLDASGNLAGGGWSWGCSHSLDVRLTMSGATPGPVCLSDCYPGKGLYYNHNSLVFSDPSGNCGGSSNASLGGLVPSSGGFYLSFASAEGRSSSDVAIVSISTSGTAGTPVWVTSTAGAQERAPHLARYGANLLVAWLDGADQKAALVDPSGTVLAGPEVLPAQAAERDDFINFANGDVGWAYAWGTMGELKVVRLTYCP